LYSLQALCVALATRPHPTLPLRAAYARQDRIQHILTARPHENGDWTLGILLIFIDRARANHDAEIGFDEFAGLFGCTECAEWVKQEV
jgi:hypothetical protein